MIMNRFVALPHLKSMFRSRKDLLKKLSSRETILKFQKTIFL